MSWHTSHCGVKARQWLICARVDSILPMNSGAEAVETAMKLARKWAYEVKGVPDEQAVIVVCKENFHGRTITIVSMSTDATTKRHFGPYTPGFEHVTFGDIAELTKYVHICLVLSSRVGGLFFVAVAPLIARLECWKDRCVRTLRHFWLNPSKARPVSRYRRRGTCARRASCVAPIMCCS